MDLLARNLENLRKIVHTLTQKGSRIKFIKIELKVVSN